MKSCPESAHPTVSRARHNYLLTSINTRALGSAISIALALSARQTPARARDNARRAQSDRSPFARFAPKSTGATRRGSAIARALAPIPSSVSGGKRTERGKVLHPLARDSRARPGYLAQVIAALLDATWATFGGSRHVI